MPKTQKNKNRSVANPILPTPMHSDMLDAESVEPAPIISKLTSASKDDRAWAAVSISNLIQNDVTREILLKNNVIGALITALPGNDIEIQIEILGALRNIIVFAGDTTCMEIYRKLILTPLSQLMSLVSQLITAVLADYKPVEDEELKVKSTFQLAEQLYNLFWNLSECCEPARAEIEESNVLKTTLEILSSLQKFPFQVVISAAQCAVSLTEDSRKARSFFNQNQNYFHVLCEIAVGDVLEVCTWDENRYSVQISAALILFNVKSILRPHPKIKSLTGNPELLEKVQESIKKSLRLSFEFDVNANVTTVIDLLAKETENENTAENASKYEKSITSVESKLQTVQSALELLANIYADEELVEEEEEAGSEANEDDVEEMMEDDIEYVPNENQEDDDEDANPMDMEDDQDFLENLALESSPTESNDDVSGLLQSLSRFCDVQFTVPLSPALKNVISLVYSIRMCSFCAISNIVEKNPKRWFIENHDLVKKFWDWLYTAAIKEGNKKPVFSDGTSLQESLSSEITENIVTVMYVISRKLYEIQDPEYTITSSETQINTFLQTFGNENTSTSMRVKCASILSIFATSENIGLNQVIGDLFMNTLAKPTTPVEVITEILNGVFDIYADEEFVYDKPVFRDLDYLGKLKQVQGLLKRKIKAVDKRKHKEARENADAAMINLKAFIDYKEKEYRKRM